MSRGLVMLALIALILPRELSALDRLLMLGKIPLRPVARPQPKSSDDGGGHRPRKHTPRPQSDDSDEGGASEPSGVLAKISPTAAYHEAETYLNNGDLARGAQRLREAAMGGVPEAEFAYATYSLMGTAGVPKSLPTANNFYEQAANHGHAMAAYNIAIAYHDGDGRPKDLSKSYHYFLEAAQRGIPEGMLQVGKLLEKGAGVAKNAAEAKGWLSKAASAGNGEAAGLLAEMAGDAGGRGGEAEKLKYLQQAADAGDAQAMNDLGLAYLNGEGVAKNRDLAKKWIHKSAAAGYDPAMTNEATLFSGK